MQGHKEDKGAGLAGLSNSRFFHQQCKTVLIPKASPLSWRGSEEGPWGLQAISKGEAPELWNPGLALGTATWARGTLPVQPHLEGGQK